MSILSAVDCGTLKLVPEASRTSDKDLHDTSVSDTWEECDLSHLVPNGTKAILGYAEIKSASAVDAMILLVRDGAGTDTNLNRTRCLRFEAEIGATGFTAFGGIVIIKATNGIFDYRQYSSSYRIDTYFDFRLWGYYI
jgi:hypothetical protein